MEASSYEVVADSLTRHARTLSGLSDELGAAIMPGEGAMTDDAYGQTARSFVAVMRDLDRAGQEALQEGVEALEDAVRSLRDNVATYEHGETEQAAVFTRLEGDVAGATPIPETKGLTS